MKAQTEVLEVSTQFDVLTGRYEEQYNVRLLLTIYFKTTANLEHLVTGPMRHYKGRLPYELDRDDDRREESSGNQRYLLHVTALGEVDPSYGDVVRSLMGQEIFEMLQLSWREESISAAISEGRMGFDDAWMARSVNQMSREAYKMPHDVARVILSDVLFK